MATDNQTNENKKIIVKIDPEVAGLIPAFLKNRNADVQLMLETLKKDDYVIIERTGHGMKGAGSGFGFDAITEIGAHIEKAAKQKDTGEIKRWIDELANYLERLEVTYE